MMKKTLYYRFIPSKAQEEACKALNCPWQVRRSVVEIREDVNEGAAVAPAEMMMRRVLSREEVLKGRIVVPFAEAFQNVFQHWTLSMTKRVVRGHKVHVVIWDVTDRLKPKRYSKGVHMRVLGNHDYAVSCMDLITELGLATYDQIGLIWDTKSSAFLLHLIRKAVPMPLQVQQRLSISNKFIV